MISEPFFSGASSAYCGLTSSTLSADSMPLLYSSSSYSAAMANSRSRRQSAMRLAISSWPASRFARRDQRAGQRFHRVAAIRRLRLLQFGFDGIELVAIRSKRRQLVDVSEHRLDLGIDRTAIRFPRAPLRFADEAQVFFFESVEFVRGGDAVADHPLAHLLDAIEFDSPNRGALSICSARASRRSNAPAAASSRRRE